MEFSSNDNLENAVSQKRSLSEPLRLEGIPDLSNFKDDFANYLDCGFQSYAMENLCGCSCNDIQIRKEMFSSCGSILSDEYGMSDMFVTCETFEDYIGICEISEEELKRYSASMLNQIEGSLLSQVISQEEFDLIANSFSMFEENGEFDVESLRSQWYNLPESKSNNVFSLSYIEMHNAIDCYFKDNNDIQRVKDPRLTAAAGFFGALGSIAYDLAANGSSGNWQYGTLDDVWQTASGAMTFVNF